MSESSNSSNKSMDKYPVIIKLALEASGDNGPFRRITFTKKEVDDVTDNAVSESLLLDTLRARAVELSLLSAGGSGGPLNVGMAHGMAHGMAQQYDVQLTYKDGDGDACVVLSNADVVDALLQCQEASSLKMFAKVTISKPRVDVADVAATPSAPATTTSTTTTTLKNQNQYQGNAPIPFHQLVESIVGVLAAALLALQSHLGQTPNSVAMIEPKYTNVAKVNVVATKSCKPPAAPTTTAPSTASRCPYSAPPVVSTAVPCAPPPSVLKDPPSTPVPQQPTAAAAAAPEQEPQESCAARPFIHGRHTCDLCLTTPIIGQRFHATNVPDYDLCANCQANYQGKNKEITFEAMELDRDRPFQDRWHRRYSKWGTTGRPHARKHCGTGAAVAVDHGRRSCGRYRNRGFAATTTTTPTPPADVPLAKPEDVDSALKEAIRRSMADLMSTVVNNNNNTPMSLRARSASSKSVEDCADRVLKKMERVASNLSQSARKMADKNDIVVKKLHKKIDKVVARHNFDEKNDVAEKFHEALESAASHVAKSMEMVAAQMDQLIVAKSSSSVLEESMPTSAPVKKELVEQPPVEKVVVESHTVKQAAPAVQVESVDIDEDDDDDDSKPNAVEGPTCALAEAAVATVHDDEKEEEIVVELCVAAVVDTPVHVEEEQEIMVDPRGVAAVVVDTSASSTTTSSSSTFALDAAGNGDVAADLGATMDKIVTAIQDMKDELDRSYASDSKKQDNINNAESSDTESFVDAQDSSEDEEEEETAFDHDDEEEVVTETQGATILSGEETLNKDHDDDDDDSGSHNSWMVVHDQVTSDEALARAAQVIGSALFNSDMSRSASGNISAMSHSQGTNDHSNVSSAASSSSESSSQVSSVGSVPTDIPSLATSGGTGTPVVAQAQMDRWVLQLSQLHELGFYNDAICVDILERLQAANVGSGEDEEVTVTQVINELMREW